MTPLAIDLFCGLGGWTEGLLAEGYRVVGFDNERHRYPARAVPDSDGTKVRESGVDFNNTGDSRKRSFNYANECAVREMPLTGGWVEYPAQLVLQDVLTLHGSQFKDAALIVASPPCQAYSYRAMPWKRAKALPPPDNTLFEACFRIQREACEAAGRFIPLVVENVRGAQPWVGRSRWHYGSFHLWGDVPALMPIVLQRRMKSAISCSPRLFSDQIASTPEEAHRLHYRLPVEAHDHLKASQDGLGGYGGGFGWDGSPMRRNNSKSSARKAASAHIAKIPLPLARHIARAWHPEAL